jgi:hypothetical protein
MSKKLTAEEFESHMVDIFTQIEEKVHRLYPNTAGRGYDMQKDALKVIPNWLVKWYEFRRWPVCFSISWKSFLNMGGSFGFSKETILAELLKYYTKGKGK